MKLIRKVISTVKVIQENKVGLLKELKDLTGITKLVVQEIVRIWI